MSGDNQDYEITCGNVMKKRTMGRGGQYFRGHWGRPV